jgi:hypothetical protein
MLLHSLTYEECVGDVHIPNSTPMLGGKTMIKKAIIIRK